MFRTTAVAALMAFSLPMAAAPAFAQGALSPPMHHHYMHHHYMYHHDRHNRMHANGLCNGRSHGTGYHGCGTATGGPVGGLPSRN